MFSCYIVGNYESAVVQFEECLSALGRPFPHTNLQLYASLLWQSVRQVLHRIYIARLFAKQASKICPDVSKSSRDAAKVYYRLLQLSMTKKVRLLCFMLNFEAQWRIFIQSCFFGLIHALTKWWFIFRAFHFLCDPLLALLFYCTVEFTLILGNMFLTAGVFDWWFLLYRLRWVTSTLWIWRYVVWIWRRLVIRL